MYDLTVPCIAFLFVFACTFIFFCWFFKHTYFRKLEQRVKWLEYQLQEPVTEEPQVQLQRVTRAPRIRYVPVERQMR